MVVLAASIVTKTGKALISRQYMDMSRIRIEGLVAAFPKLVGTGKQHTYVETENVRYIYQPMEGLYLLLVTNKQSNILEDLDTLRLLSKVVPEYSTTLEEESIQKNAFDLVFAFDEVISLGHKENVNLQQVKQNCAMESHEEKLHKMILQSKMREVNEVMKAKASAIDKSKIDAKVDKSKAMGGFNPSSMGSVTSPSFGRGDDVPSFKSETTFSAAAASTSSSKGKKGMVLAPKAKKADDFLETLAKEGDAVQTEAPVRPSGPAAALAAVSAEPVTIDIEEKLTVVLQRQGGLENLEVQGTMSLVVRSEADAYIRVAVDPKDSRAFQFKTHPNIDKALHASQNLLGLKDPSRPFPAGSPLGILKWRLQGKDEELVPLNINCWPSVSGRETYVNIEYEATEAFELQNVVITIPLPNVGHAPTVNQIDGEWRYDQRKVALIWTIELIDESNRSGCCEFVVSSTDTDAFYPIDVSFSSAKTFCEIEVETVKQIDGGAPVQYSCSRTMSTSSYQVV